MSITVTEKLESRRLLASRDGKASTYTLLYNVFGTDNEFAAKNAVNFIAPPVVGSGFPQLWLQQIEVQYLGSEMWEAVARYDTSGPEPLSADDSFAFEIGGGTAHITQALATGRYPVSLPDQEGAIGVTDDGVQGADIYAPEMSFEETHLYAEISPGYKRDLFEMKGRVNSAPFRGWSAGEVLFEGVSARRQDNRTSTPWSVTYRFRVSPNRTIQIAGETIEKSGWELLDVRYEKTVDSDTLVHRAIGAYLHQVYETADFAALAIGN